MNDNNLSSIWLQLTNESIGFYTYHNASDIPTSPGVYAWFNPIHLKFKEDITEQLLNMRRIQSYDALVKDKTKLSEEYDLNWDPIKVTLEKHFESIKLTNTDKDSWKEISKEDKEIIRNSKLYALIGTLFTRPLYIGLTRNLNNRYNNHINGHGGDNNFNKRFSNYIKKIGMTISISDLLFVSIQFKDLDTYDDYKNGKLKKHLMLIESILKVLGQPIFSEK